jgi:aminopeptidase N
MDVLDYSVDLQIDRPRTLVRGIERIQVRAIGMPLLSLTFPRNGINVLAVTASGGSVAPRITDKVIEVPLPVPLAPGAVATVAFTYVAHSPRGVRVQPNGVYTIFFSCYWMVCREEPDDKATISLALTLPEGMTVVASGTPERSERTRHGMVRHVWRERRPYSSYLFAFAAGRLLRTVEQHGRTQLEFYDGSTLNARALARMFADTGAMLDFFERKAGIPFPQPAYRQILVDGDEAQEATSFSILGRKTLDRRLQAPDEDWPIAHELAHQFWGNLVTCADWSHLWLNEGLAVFMVAAWKEHRWGRDAYLRELDLARQRRQVAIDAGFDVPLTYIADYPSLRLKRAIVYSKGALFLALLRETMGDASFWSALRTYTQRFAGRSVVSADFHQVFAAATSRDLRPLFDTWVDPRL